MSEASAERTEQATPEAVGEQEAGSSYWPDELVDTISALAVLTFLTLGVLWFVVNG